jgi:hypothetical protein
MRQYVQLPGKLICLPVPKPEQVENTRTLYVASSVGGLRPWNLLPRRTQGRCVLLHPLVGCAPEICYHSAEQVENTGTQYVASSVSGLRPWNLLP